MSVYRTSLLAFASLLPIALALPAQAANEKATGFVILGADDKIFAHRDIGGHDVKVDRCYWYNFHQSISLWPVYKACGAKTAVQWRDTYHSTNTNGFSENAVALINRQNTTSHNAVYTNPDKHIRLEINKHYDKTPCAWFNYIQSRHRTPIYRDCPGKDHQASYGMYSAPDFLKSFTTPGSIEQERTYDKSASNKPAPVVLNDNRFDDKVSKKLGNNEITLTRCEWSNFFQSLSFLPRYLACKVATNGDQLKNYEKNGNLNKIEFKFGVDGSSQDGSEFKKFLVLKVGTNDVKATVCEWYNLVQSEVRWPIYRTCPTNTSDGTKYQVKTIPGPNADRLVRHELLYSN